ncbi:RES family NAD+ phosphorylase [Vibrio mediterranei]|uniref:RES domain-containing protein n=2 Tax=Vibrio TaxID=662 RepID=A0AAN1FLR6_9VIBR|nr:RES domain-containing protein [Vibrio mediterranei]ASI92572.1 hypothetical protein BSZ05_22545 [Vibrio mediterranei]
MLSQTNPLISTLLSAPLTKFQGVCYRMHNPVWAWSPLSTEGASRVGGRFNPKGSPALYLSLKPETCIAEVAGGASTRLLDPMTLCSYHIDINGVLDLRLYYQEFSPGWRLELLKKKQPLGWVLYQALQQRPEVKALLVPSYQMVGEYNLVAIRWEDGEITLYDPDGRLAAVYGKQLIIKS